MQFSDLPNGGHNLRLYTYDPIGSPYGPKQACGVEPTNTWIYNTGHYDIALGTPCSQPDPQGFCDSQTMNQYAASRGEMLVMVSRTDLTALCGYRAPVTATAPKTVQTSTSPTAGGTIQSGGVGGVTVVGGSTPGSVTDGYIPPPGTPISDGGLPGGVGTTGNATTTGPLTSIYRFILLNPSPTDPGNPYSTGANYPGCSPTNTANCKGMNFPSEAAAIAYAEANGEIPYRVLTANEVWGIINGTIPIDPTRILSSSSGLGLGAIIAAALGLWFLSGR